MKEFRSLSALAAAVIIAGVLNACANGDAASRNAEENAAFLENATPTSATLSGNYLAGRFAQRNQDWDAAQKYMSEVVGFDGNNSLLTQRAFLLAVGARQYDKAHELALKITQGVNQSELAIIYLACDALSRENYQDAMEYLDKLPDEGFGDYTKPLLSAWSLAGLGRKEEALAVLGKNASSDDPAYNMHAGLIHELSGDMKAAATHYKTAMESGLTLHSATVVSRFFDRYGQPKVANMIYESLARLYPFNPFIEEDAATGSSSHANITRAADGAGYALFDIATLLFERRAYDSAQIYGSLVQLLTPSSPFALLMMGDIAALHDQHGKSVASYEAIPRQSPLYWISRMRIAEVYESTGQLNKATELLTALSKRPETRYQALVTLGDIHRRNENFASALKSYDEALTGIDILTEEHWAVIYARGMSLERLNNWTRAEKDLLMALEFQPDNPMILNFIGYSWADKGLHLDKALDYIRRAVALRPYDGYILDSYGWALYRTGDYAQAIVWLEKAIAQVPGDGTILDHLGDAYWRVGRENEARFQWRKALGASQDAAFKNIVSSKLRHGLERTAPTQAVKEAKL